MMLYTIFSISFLIFKEGKSFFEVDQCFLSSDEANITTHWKWYGKTRWNNAIQITGIDYFWFDKESDKIIHHDSRWDQTADELLRSLTESSKDSK